jgi:hypothetical protein
MANAFGIDDDRYISKADERSSGNPSAGRRAAHWAGGGYHTLAVSPKGRRLKNLGRDEGSTALGVAPGAAVMGVAGYKGLKHEAASYREAEGLGRAKKIAPHVAGVKRANAAIIAGGVLAGAGGLAARQTNLTSMNRKGYLKKEEVKKGIATGLKMVAGAGKKPSRAAMFGAVKKPVSTKELGRTYRSQLEEHLQYNLKKPS